MRLVIQTIEERLITQCTIIVHKQGSYVVIMLLNLLIHHECVIMIPKLY